MADAIDSPCHERGLSRVKTFIDGRLSQQDMAIIVASLLEHGSATMGKQKWSDFVDSVLSLSGQRCFWCECRNGILDKKRCSACGVEVSLFCVKKRIGVLPQEIVSPLIYYLLQHAYATMTAREWDELQVHIEGNRVSQHESQPATV